MTQAAPHPAPATMAIAFDNSYARLPPHLYARIDPEPAPKPRLIAWNAALARDLGLPEAPEDTRAAVFSGTTLPEGAEPLAMAYAGHQFGGFVPQLGDGRAHLLGEVIARDGTRMDIQLKGSGRTPFSRGGDGLAWIGPVLREYLASEAMAAMGVPTTRALAAVTTGAPVWREAGRLPGAVLTRVAQSHIRVGTFQYFAVRRDVPAIRTLFDHARARHFPQAETPADFLRATVAAQAELVAHWMGLGFIHGVMNTDNCHIGGLTIDYGPCAFMDAYHPETVFSSIDQFGRYAYANQPQIAVWNLAQLATCLLPLMQDDQDAAIAEATEIVHGFAPLYEAAHGKQFAAKLGLADRREGDDALLQTLLDRMAKLGADFTRVFHGLRTGKAAAEFREPEAFEAWAADWRTRLAAEGTSEADAKTRMSRANPGIIPRNHRVEEAITAAVAGDFAPFQRLHTATTRPFDPAPGDADLMDPPRPEERVQATFCGT